jgi:hypothetical protein
VTDCYTAGVLGDAAYNGRREVVADRSRKGAVSIALARLDGRRHGRGREVVGHQPRVGVHGKAVAGQTEGLDDRTTGGAEVGHGHARGPVQVR